MTITPADSLDLLIAHGPPDATDFAKQIAGLPGAYYAGLDEAYKRRTQDAFQGGVPTTNPNDPNSPVDLNAIYKKLLTTGGTSVGLPVAAGLQQQANQQALGEAARRAFPDANPFPPATGSPAIAAPAPTPPITPQQPGTIAGQPVTPSISALIPSGYGQQEGNRLGLAIAQGLNLPGADLEAPLTPQQIAQAQPIVDRFQAARAARSAPPTATSVPPTLSSVQDPAVASQRAALEQRRNALQQLGARAEAMQKGAGKPYLDAAAEIDKQLQPTEAQKNAFGDKLPGESQADYEARKAGQEESAKKFAGIASEMFDKASKNADAAQAAKYRLDLIDHSILELGPKWMGSGAATRFEIAKGVNTALDNILPKDLADRVKFDPKKIANVEDFNKQTQTLGFELAKTLGSREAMQIVQQATNSVPNFAQSELGAKLVSSSLRQAAQREEDHFAYIADHKGDLKASLNFNKQNPPEMYSTRAIAASGIPPQLKPGDEKKVGYLPPGTKYMWNGKPWTKN